MLILPVLEIKGVVRGFLRGDIYRNAPLTNAKGFTWVINAADISLQFGVSAVFRDV